MQASRFDLSPQSRNCRPRGFSLLEVMLAIVVILLGLVPLLHLMVKCLHMHHVAESLTQGTLMAESQLSELLAKSTLAEGHHQGRCELEATDVQYSWSAEIEPLSEPMIESMPLTGLWHVTMTLTWVESSKDREVTLETVVQNPNQSRIQTMGAKTSSEEGRRGTL